MNISRHGTVYRPLKRSRGYSPRPCRLVIVVSLMAFSAGLCAGCIAGLWHQAAQKHTEDAKILAHK